MAFESRGPVMLTLPPFRGVTRRLVLGAAVGFLVYLLLGMSPLGGTVLPWVALIPAHLPRSPYTLVSYAFFPSGLLSTIFALLSVWFFGMPLEEERGAQWMLELFFASTAGGALLASVLALLIRMPAFGPLSVGVSMWPFATALLLAFARFYPDAQIRLFGIIPIRAKVLAAAYIGLYLLLSLVGGDRFGAALAVCSSLCAWLYLQFAGRRGLAWRASESVYGARNAWYRRKRQSAAKKFQVYMKKQGRDGHFDERGHFIQDDKD